MGQLGALTSFASYARILAAEVNANFTLIRDWANTYAVLTDTTQTITGAKTFSSAISAAAGLVISTPISYADGDTTPTVAGAGALTLANTGATTITNFDDGEDQQLLILYFSDGNTTINRDNAYLAGGANFTGSANDVLILQLRGSTWWEISRSVNS